MSRVCLYCTITISLVFHEAISIGYEDATVTSIVTFDTDDPPPSTPAVAYSDGNTATGSYPGSPGFVPLAGAGTTRIFANVGNVDPGTASLGGGGNLGTGTSGVPNSIGGSAGAGVNTIGINSRLGNLGTGTGVTGVPGAIGTSANTENANIGGSSLGIGTTGIVGSSESTLDNPRIINSGIGNVGTGVPSVIGSPGPTVNAHVGGAGLGLGSTGMIGGSGNMNPGTGNLGTGSTGFLGIGNSGTTGNANVGGGGIGLGTTDMVGGSENMNSGSGNLGTDLAGVLGVVRGSGSAGGSFGGSLGSENGKVGGGVSTSNGPFTGNTASSGFGSNGLLNPGGTGVTGVVGFGIGNPSSALGNGDSGVIGSSANTGNPVGLFLGTGGMVDSGTGVIGGGSGNNGFGLPASRAIFVGGNPTSSTGTTSVGSFMTNPQLNSQNPPSSQVSSNDHVIPYNIYATVYANIVPHDGGTSITSGGSVSDRGISSSRSWTRLRNSGRRRSRPPPIVRRITRLNRRRSQFIRITIDEGGRVSSVRRV